MPQKNKKFLVIEKKKQKLFYLMALNIMENGLLEKILDKVVVYKFGLMDHYMKVIGLILRLLTKADLFMLMEMFMMDIGKMIKLMVKDDMFILTEPAILEIGYKTNNTVRVMKPGLMVLHLKVITLKEKSMVMESLFGLIKVSMMVNF